MSNKEYTVIQQSEEGQQEAGRTYCNRKTCSDTLVLVSVGLLFVGFAFLVASQLMNRDIETRKTDAPVSNGEAYEHSVARLVCLVVGVCIIVIAGCLTTAMAVYKLAGDDEGAVYRQSDEEEVVHLEADSMPVYG